MKVYHAGLQENYYHAGQGVGYKAYKSIRFLRWAQLTGTNVSIIFFNWLSWRCWDLAAAVISETQLKESEGYQHFAVRL